MLNIKAINPIIEKQMIKPSTSVAIINRILRINIDVVIKGKIIKIKLGTPKNISKNEVIKSKNEKLILHNE